MWIVYENGQPLTMIMIIKEGDVSNGFKKVLQENIDHLSSIGNDPTGGMTRLLYSDSWLEAQKSVKEKLEAIGMTASFDEIGNLFW